MTKDSTPKPEAAQSGAAEPTSADLAKSSTTASEPKTDLFGKAIKEENTRAARGRIGVLTLAVAALFGLVYAYFVWQAIGNLIELPKSYSAIGIGDKVPWVLLVIGLLVPVVGYVVAFWAGLRSPLVNKVVIFVMGLATVAALGYSVVAVHRALFSAVISNL